MSARSSKPSQFHAPAVMDLCLSQEDEEGAVDVGVDVEDVVATEVATAIMAAKLTKMEITDEAEEEVEEEDEDEAEGEGANQLKRNNLRQHTEFLSQDHCFNHNSI